MEYRKFRQQIIGKIEQNQHLTNKKKSWNLCTKKQPEYLTAQTAYFFYDLCLGFQKAVSNFSNTLDDKRRFLRLTF